jgi:hypothetical protein
MLPTHGRHACSPWPERARHAWPGGAKLAVCLGTKLGHFAFGKGLGAELAPGTNGDGPRRCSTGGLHPCIIGQPYRL